MLAADRSTGRKALRAGGTVLAVAVAMFVLFGRPSLNGDVIHSLIWGRSIAHGRLPAYAEGPTPHPLPNLLSAALSLLGPEGAYHVTEALALVLLAALLVVVAELGRVAYSLPVGLVAVAILLTDRGLLNRALSGIYDVAAVTLALLALIVVLRSPARLALAAALVAAAGLIRPEYWLFGGILGLYAVATHRSDALRVCAIGAAAPVLWIGSDTIVTGHPLWSLTHTQDLAGVLERPTGIQRVPGAFYELLRDLTSRLVLLLAAAGAVVGLWLRPRVTLGLLAVVVAGAVTLTAIGAAELSLIDRYLLPSSVILSLLAAYAIAGWTRERAHRRVLLCVGAASVLLLLADLPSRVSGVESLRTSLHRRTAVLDDLRAVVLGDRCRPAHVPYPIGITVPTAAQVQGVTPARVLPLRGPRGSGSVVGPRTPATVASIRVFGTDPLVVPRLPGTTVHESRYWTVKRLRCDG